MSERGKHGLMPVTMVQTFIKAESRVDGINTVRVGEVMEFFIDLSKRHGGIPTGWLAANGDWYWRGEWPELAPICRSRTSWFRWHVLRQFRVPNFNIVVAVDPVAPAVYPEYGKPEFPPFGDVHDDRHNRPPPSRWD